MKKNHFYFFIISFLLFFPLVIAFGDGGMMIWPPMIELNQSAQNAIVGWNGSEEVMILSIDVESAGNITALRVIPLPSEPKISEGSFESFETLVSIMNEKRGAVDGYPMALEGEGETTAEPGIEIVFQEQIGAHSVTTVKVNDLNDFLDWVQDFAFGKGFEQKQISAGFKQGIDNYLKKEVNYFVFDVINADQKEVSIEPLVYRFESDFLYFPILISGISEISESSTQIDLFLITDKQVEFNDIPHDYYKDGWFYNYGHREAVSLTLLELESISLDVSDLFQSSVYVQKASIHKKLSDLNKDLMLFPSYLFDNGLTVGDRGEAVQALQKVLINEGVWESDVEATGYFGSITQTALKEFQQEHLSDFWSFEEQEGSGMLDTETQDYFQNLSLDIPYQEPEFSFDRNLYLGMRGDDVTALQEVLIGEGVWNRPDINATGYFGQITKTAVIEYQEKYASEILQPLGLTFGTGFVGVSTRAHLEL